MSKIATLDEEKSIRLRQRLWGAAVLIALLVIFLPLVLDGSGSESQYRRVESLRAEPPRILDADGNPEPAARATQPELESASSQSMVPDDARRPVEQRQTSEQLESQPQRRAVPQPATAEQNVRTDAIQAWVVQAGSFQEEANALAVRDRLRRAGFPSFVTPNDATKPLFRVRVGPMISLQQAEKSRDNIMRLLQREAIVVSYP